MHNRPCLSVFLSVISLLFLSVFALAGHPYYDSYEDYTSKQQCFNSSDGIIRYVDEGKGEPIVLLHGVPTSGWMYRKMIGDLAQKGFRVIVPDMLGFGNSASPRGAGVYTPRNHGKRLLELMDHLKINNWTQVVHDAGSLWTAELSKEQPDRIKRIVFLNSILDPSGVNWDQQIELGLSVKVGLMLQRWGVRKSSFVSDFIQQNLSGKKIDKVELLGYEIPITNGKTQAIFEHYTYMIDHFFGEKSVLHYLQKPAMVIWGNTDEVLLWQAQQELVRNELNLEEKLIFELPFGHLIPEEAPAKLDSLITLFVEPQ